MTEITLKQSFAGGLTIQPGQFEMRAERLIVSDTKISFQFDGHDHHGSFKVEGVAVLEDDGSFIATQICPVYAHNIQGPAGDIEFLIVRTDFVDSQSCYVDGLWSEPSKHHVVEHWRFAGRLDLFNATV